MFAADIFEAFQPYDGALVFDNNWAAFQQKCATISPSASIEQACEQAGFTPQFFTKVVDNAFVNWREATTGSILHGIDYLHLGQVPPAGQAVFVNLEWQTRFFLKCQSLSPVFRYDTVPMVRNGQRIMIRDKQALGATTNVITPANRILRCLYLYWLLNSIKSVKLPKKIYRGVRAHDLYNHETLKPAIAAIFASDQTFRMRRKQAVDVLIRWICEQKLHQITDGQLLSFTASIPVAKYFASGEGLILAVDPTKVEIISSELHDERLQGRDHITDRNEREYIVRIPADYAFKPDDIQINDLDYLVAEENPLSVAFFSHDDIEAQYTMNGVAITAWYSWQSNTRGGLMFNATKPGSKEMWWGRREIAKAVGFDPLPTKANLNQISNFVIKKHRQF